MARIPPHERSELARAGLISRTPTVCEVCGRALEPGDRVMCNDGYERVYGEYVLVEPDELHEDNNPYAHAACAAAE